MSSRSAAPGVRTASGRRSHGVVQRLSWGVADQAVSSLSNFALGIVVARSLGSAGFGAFTLAYVTYAFVLSATRGLATDPLLVRFSGPPSAAWRQAVRSATATATAAGAVAGVGCILLAPLLPAGIRDEFVALGFVLPALMLQDSLRFAFFSVGRGSSALLNDLAWGVLLVLALAGLVLTGNATAVGCILAFGVTAALAAVGGLFQCHVLPRPTAIRSWIVGHRDLGSRYLVENVSIGGARQARMFALGAFAGLAAVGDTRAAEILMGPFLVILMGASQVAVPEAAQVLARSPQRLGRFCLVFGTVLAVAAAAWGLTVVALMPTGVGHLLLGSMWIPAATLLPPVILGMVAGGFEIAAAAGVRALGAARRSLRAQLTNAALYVVGGSLGAYLDGAWGSCWGVAIATGLGALVWWYQLRRALADHLTASPGCDTQPDNLDRMTT